MARKYIHDPDGTRLPVKLDAASNGECQRFHDDRASDPLRRRPERHSKRNLATPLRHHVGEQRIYPARGGDQAANRE